MPFHYKAMIIVMFITPIMFALAKPLFTHFMSVEDFNRRRNIWLAVTLAAFLIPDFWIFMVVASVMLIHGARKDSNPAAFYMLMLLVVPPVGRYIPGFGIVNYILQIHYLRLLSLVVLLPLAVRLFNGRHSHDGTAYAPSGPPRGLLAFDVLILLYVGLQIVLMAPYQSATSSLRAVVEQVLGVLLPYYVLSRSINTREQLVEALACFVLTAAVLVPLACIETLRGWVLYVGMERRWEGPHMFANLMRGDLLRAQVSTGHSLVFGFAMAIALGMWFYLRTRVESRGWRALCMFTLFTGLVVALARGPWMGALIILVLFAAFGPNAGKRMAQTLGALAVVVAVTLVSPYSDRVLDYLPFVGSIDAGTQTYREQLATMSWHLIQQNPIFGSPYYIQYMEELRQGEGIIDLVNTYAAVALSYGLVGAGLFVAFFTAIGISCLRVARQIAPLDPDFSMLGVSIVACTFGILFMIAGVSYYLGIPFVQISLAGMGVAYLRLARHASSQEVTAETSLNDMKRFGRVAGY